VLPPQISQSALEGGKSQGQNAPKQRRFVMKNERVFGVILFILGSFVLLGCASIKPLSDETLENYGLLEDTNKFKNYQYFISWDIVPNVVNEKKEDEKR
jgi:hypothetical protein